MNQYDIEICEEGLNKLYLAHTFYSRKWVREWELKIEKSTGIELVNPFYDRKNPEIEYADQGMSRRDVSRLVSPTNVVKGDLKQIDECDGIIAIVDGSRAIGTIMEIFYNNWIEHYGIGLVTNGEDLHPWLRYCLDEIYTNIEGLEERLKEVR